MRQKQSGSCGLHTILSYEEGDRNLELQRGRKQFIGRWKEQMFGQKMFAMSHKYFWYKKLSLVVALCLVQNTPCPHPYTPYIQLTSFRQLREMKKLFPSMPGLNYLQPQNYPYAKVAHLNGAFISSHYMLSKVYCSTYLSLL